MSYWEGGENTSGKTCGAQDSQAAASSCTAPKARMWPRAPPGQDKLAALSPSLAVFLAPFSPVR